MSTTEWKFVPVESDENMATAFFDRVTVTSRGGLIGIRSALNSAIAAAPVPPSVESLLESWTPSDRQAFSGFINKHFPGEMSSYAIQSLGSAWKDGQANASTEVPQYTGTGSDSLDCILGVGGFASFGPLDSQPSHLTIPGALEWDGDNGTHGADGESRDHSESAYDDAKEACAEVERTGSPGDVIREMNDELVDLRAQLANTEQSRHSFFDLSQDLEKRLAERDAAIKEFIRINGMSVQNSSAHNKALLALAAIVDPAKCESCGGWGHIETEDSAHDCPECGLSVVERAVEAGVMNAPKPYAAMSEAEADEFLSSFGGGSGNKAKRRITAMEKAKGGGDE